MVDIAAIRRDAGVTQTEMAERLRMTQGAVSQTEHRDDLKLGTLVEYLAALGATVHITVNVADRVYEYGPTEGEPR